MLVLFKMALYALALRLLPQGSACFVTGTLHGQWMYFIEIISYGSYSHIFSKAIYEGWNFNSGNYLFTTDTE